MKAEIELVDTTSANGDGTTFLLDVVEISEEQFREIWKTARWRDRTVVGIIVHGKHVSFCD